MDRNNSQMEMSSATSTPQASMTNSSNQAQSFPVRTKHSLGLSFSKKGGPNPNTIADGYSISDERHPITGPDVDYDYNDDINPGMRNPVLERQQVTMLLHQSHPGEHRKDFGEIPVTLMPQVTTWVLCAAINSCNLGYDIGLNASASVVVQKDLELSDLQLHFFISSMNFFAIIGALFAYTMSDYFGRRHAFAVAGIHFICGVIVVAVAHSFTALMVGRVFLGLGVGFGLALDPMYIAEITPAQYRGSLVTYSELGTNFGIILGLSSGLLFGGLVTEISWRFMYAMGGIMPLLMIYLAKFVMVESPRWLMLKDQHEKARGVLQKIYGENYDISPIILDMKEAFQREEADKETVGWDILLFPKPAVRRMLFIGVCAAVAQQAVGIDAIQHFLIYILRESGIDSLPAQLGILISISFVKLIFIMIGGRLFDTRGRRSILFISLCGMTASLILLSINFFGSTNSVLITIIGLATYLSLYSLGVGPGSWLIIAEIFPTSIRAKAVSLCTFCNRIAASLMSSTFLSTATAMSWSGFFLLLSSVCILILIFLYYFLPETRGRSLESMSIFFAEIAGDHRLLDDEARITREREAAQHVQETAPRFMPKKPREIQRGQLLDAKITGTMA